MREKGKISDFTEHVTDHSPFYHAESFDEILDGLSEEEREIIICRFVYEMPFAEIAVNLSVSEEAAKKVLDDYGKYLKEGEAVPAARERIAQYKSRDTEFADFAEDEE